MPDQSGSALHSLPQVTSWVASTLHQEQERPGGELFPCCQAVYCPGVAELESYGQMVVANPDFVDRLRTGAVLNEADRQTYFGGGAQGYIDYPVPDKAL